jgi:hypothetical protein
MPTIPTSDEPTRVANETDRGTYRGVIGVVHCSKVRCAVLGPLAVCENFDWGMGNCGPCNKLPDRFTYPTVGVVNCPKVRCAVLGSLVDCENGVGHLNR